MLKPFFVSRSIRSLTALGAAILLGLACERTPDTYDYHGPAPDISGLDQWTPSDVRALDVDSIAPTDTTPPLDLKSDTTPDAHDVSIPDQIELPDLPTPSTRTRDCTFTVKFTPPDGSAPALASELFVSAPEQPWVEAEKPMTADGNGSYKLDIDFAEHSPGSYGYKFHTASDNWYLDTGNPLAKFQGGFENSKFLVPDCRLPQLKLASKELNVAAGTLSLTVEVYDGAGSVGTIPSTASVRVNGVDHATGYDPETASFSLQLDNLKKGSKVTVLFSISNEFGAASPLYVPVWLEETPWTWKEASMYFAFTDRFANGDSGNDAPANCDNSPDSTDWSGGDFLGLKQKIDSGYFDQLGVNVLWISPVVDNPNGCFGGSLAGIKYTAYHGYFPVDFYKTEEHYGSIEELRDMINAAHDHGIRVLVDFVGNHCHQDSPLWADHANDGWFSAYTSCEPKWDQPISCWFQSYLPDFDYTKDEVVEYVADNALFWIRETGVDGFRVDAVKHMVHNFVRTIRWKIQQEIVDPTGVPFYMVGETFVSEWGGGTGSEEATIKEYISDWELDGQFDFPFYWKILKAVGRDEGDFTELSGFLQAALPYWGTDSLMVSFIGNHDVPRFASHAGKQISDMWGNGSKEQGVSSPPAQPEATEAYARTRLALGLMFTLPEIPLIYYGDEVGLAGAGDPDNRRMMPFDGLSANQTATLEFTRKVGQARKELVPLRLGDFSVVSVTASQWVFRRGSGGANVFVVANRSKDAATVSFQPQVSGNLTNYLTGDTVPVNGGNASVALDGFGMAILTSP